MHRVKASFTDFELYHEAVANWELDFRLLSKNDFFAYLNMYSNQNFQLTRTKLNGKIEQFGLTPLGFRSIVIPVNYYSTFNWLHKKVSGNQLLIFPKNRTLDAVSYDNFDVYVIAIRESLLFQLLEDLKYSHAKTLFKLGDEQYLKLSQNFALQFHHLSQNFLQKTLLAKPENLITNTNYDHQLIDNILILLLKYIDNSHQFMVSSPQRKRDKAIKQAIDLINNNNNNNNDKLISVSQLCHATNVSERTLEYAFLEKYKVTPSDYIKSNRINRVKNELIIARDKKINISTLAGKYGFWHMGQFAADFKNQFGILPSELLKQKFN